MESRNKLATSLILIICVIALRLHAPKIIVAIIAGLATAQYWYLSTSIPLQTKKIVSVYGLSLLATYGIAKILPSTWPAVPKLCLLLTTLLTLLFIGTKIALRDNTKTNQKI